MVALASVETIAVLRETLSIDNRGIQVGIGAFVTLVSLARLAYELTVAANTGGPALFPGLTFLIGIWFLLEARPDFVEGRGSYTDEEMDSSEMMPVMDHAHLVAEELKMGPQTAGKLADACYLTESRVREARDVSTDEGAVYRVDRGPSDDAEGYARDESKVEGVAFVRSNGKCITRRLARPFRR